MRIPARARRPSSQLASYSFLVSSHGLPLSGSPPQNTRLFFVATQPPPTPPPSNTPSCHRSPSTRGGVCRAHAQPPRRVQRSARHRSEERTTTPAMRTKRANVCYECARLTLVHRSASEAAAVTPLRHHVMRPARGGSPQCDPAPRTLTPPAATVTAVKQPCAHARIASSPTSNGRQLRSTPAEAQWRLVPPTAAGRAARPLHPGDRSTTCHVVAPAERRTRARAACSLVVHSRSTAAPMGC
jgi:hypothetical protein